ncbi:MAG TPA: YtcA family lipoprotein [Paraburkholderia sp.]
MPRFSMGWARRIIGVAAAIPVAGCNRSPSINVLGAYFPDWLFCIVAGVVLAIVVYAVLQRLQFADRLGPAAVLYPAFVTFFALVVWLIFFQH